MTPNTDTAAHARKRTPKPKPKPKPKLTLTGRKLIEMLTENTGSHMLDSGGAYGRNWSRNQSRDFMSEPATTLEIEAGNPKYHAAEISLTHNVFHWLRERLEYNPHLTRAFLRYAEKPENKDTGWLGLMETWAADVRHGTGIYGDGSPYTVNTYNGEDLLSQVIQYTFWTEDNGDRAYVLLQIHGGCDVRGGYTAPKVFEVCGMSDETAIFDNAKATIAERVPDDIRNHPRLPGMETRLDDPYWTTDDGYHWYFEGGCGMGAGRQLDTYEVSEDPADKGNGKIFVDADGTAYGPIYGGKLEAFSYP